MTTPAQTAIDASVRYLFEVGQLKLSKRTGWWHAGVPEPESVADHCPVPYLSDVIPPE